MSHDTLPPKPAFELGKYVHYKGKHYETVMLAMNEATHEWCVIYRALYDTGENPKEWIRTYEDFMALLPDGRARFERID
jgi:hypothetical protein